jgi:acyl carrier protein
MNQAELAETVFAVIRDQAATPEMEIRPDTPLGPDGLGIDSVGCLEIVLELERRTGRPLRDENLTAESLATPAGLIRLLEQAGHG